VLVKYKMNSLLAPNLEGFASDSVGFTEVHRISLRDTPGWSIEVFEPVSKIRSRCTPSISAVIVGVLCSSKMEAVRLLTAFSGAQRWRELPSLTPLTRFPDRGFSEPLLV
jgi:hypothetical protein